jgi:hypothetical protein
MKDFDLPVVERDVVRVIVDGTTEISSMGITSNRYLTLLCLFGAAGISYAVGFTAGTWVFIALGVIFELTFWVELFKRRR